MSSPLRSSASIDSIIQCIKDNLLLVQDQMARNDALLKKTQRKLSFITKVMLSVLLYNPPSLFKWLVEHGPHF